MALPQDGQDANGLTKVTQIPAGKELMFIDPTTNEGGIITLEDLTKQILNGLTSQTFGLDSGTQTLPAAINYLYGNNASLHDGDILTERSLIFSANHTRTASTLSFDIITNNIDVSEGTVLCKLREKYRPAFAFHALGYSYNPKEIIELSISPNGDIVVFGKYSLKGVRIYFSVSYLLK